MAVFPEDTNIPLETVEKLWTHARLDDLDTENLCKRLFRLFLLLHFDSSTRMIRLHDVIRSYLRKKYERQLPLMHDRLLNAYGVDQWAGLPSSEPYLWKHLAYHLVDCGQTKNWQHVLCDYKCLKGKLAASDVHALLADFDYLPDDQVMTRRWRMSNRK